MVDDLTVTRLSTDEQLIIERLRAGDGKAIAAIHRRYGDELKLFCQRMTKDPAVAEDMVQEVLTACCELRTQTLPNSSIRGWLYQVARHRCIDVIRRQEVAARGSTRPTRRRQTSYDHAVDPFTTPAGRALKRDRALKTMSVLDELDDDLRSIVIMRYFQELSRDEIAEAIGLSIAGTKSRLSKAMQAMREKMNTVDDSSV